jgi:DNA-directed RNA polymerase specialized sigma24 family protein
MSENIKRNNELYPAVVAGDAAAREAMILNNLGLVAIKAHVLICQIPGVAYLRDDLVSAGNVGLVRAVQKINPKVCMGAVNHWLGRFINREMRKLLPAEHTIRVPRQTSDLARHNGRPIPAPVVSNALSETLHAHSDLSVVDLRDVMSACCRSDAERQCLRLREEGYRFKEISRLLGVSLPTANLMFRKLKARVLDYWTNAAWSIRPAAAETPLEKLC